jgi:hypothetical protein
MEISGSCYCDSVQFKLNVAPRAVVNCHCDFCRRHSGAAFSTYAVVPETAFEISSGQDAIAVFELKADAFKHFCKRCGSPIYNKNARYPGLCMVYLGGLSGCSAIVPTANIYCDSQLAWVPELAGIRNFAEAIVKTPKS